MKRKHNTARTGGQLLAQRMFTDPQKKMCMCDKQHLHLLKFQMRQASQRRQTAPGCVAPVKQVKRQLPALQAHKGSAPDQHRRRLDPAKRGAAAGGGRDRALRRQHARVQGALRAFRAASATTECLMSWRRVRISDGSNQKYTGADILACAGLQVLQVPRSLKT